MFTKTIEKPKSPASAKTSNRHHSSKDFWNKVHMAKKDPNFRAFIKEFVAYHTGSK
ncbi:MAG: hypothetical protein J4224_05380 [Candidatus Diapherotrites archaeon]|uniref:Uncharacterized protein n=1 Tax=Candidatus Iainarchaeum sp. TaxID=3101447 RepID=A0A7J4IUS0_9ARCH|nr:MAG: hypothetical protein QT03_C0001G0564 [archaeon GW2011_AR10]MBS3059824.1 hypothetical protein [Candidatus Diapherotrites archaeon]HIH08570.1 hypothetical protein [Candidatus Diapherotrites archaeon]